MLKIFFKNIFATQIIFKNTFWLILGNILSRIFKLFLVIAVARNLGPAGYGRFQYIFSLLGFVYMFGDLGINSIFLRDFQLTANKNKLLKIVGWLNLILATVWLGLSLIVSLFLDENVKYLFLILTAFFFLQNIKSFFLTIFKALNKMEIESLLLISQNLLISLLGIILVKLHPSVLNLALAYFLSEVVIFLITFSLIFKEFYQKINLSISIDKNLALTIIKNSLPFILGSIIGYILTNTDVLMIRFFLDEWFVGEYTIGIKIVNFLYFLSSALSLASFPILTQKQKNQEFNSILNTFLTFLLIISLPIALGGFSLKHRIIVGFFGEKYNYGVEPFSFIILSLPFAYLTIFLNYIILIYNLQLKAFILNILTAVLNIVANFLLIPHLKLNGAAIATSISQIVNFLLFLNIVNQQTKFLKTFSLFNLSKILIANVVNLFFVIFLLQLNLSTYIIILSSIIFYFAILFSLKEKTTLSLIKIFSEMFSAKNLLSYSKYQVDWDKDLKQD